MSMVKTTLALICIGLAIPCNATDELILTAHVSDGDAIPYILTRNTLKPKLAFILLPGGDGMMNPRLDENQQLVFGLSHNFLIRSRNLFAGADAIAISTNSSNDPDKIMSIIDDIERRYYKIPIYIVGTSRGTLATMSLAKKMDGRVAGFIHTSSMSQVDWFNTNGLISRQLLVHHKDDGCRLTPYRAALNSSESYGTTLISMEGGQAFGDPCQAYGYHGFNGIETETVAKIKAWAAGSP